MFSVATPDEAKRLLTLTCQTNVEGDYVAKELVLAQTLENLFAFGNRLKYYHDRVLKACGDCACDPYVQHVLALARSGAKHGSAIAEHKGFAWSSDISGDSVHVKRWEIGPHPRVVEHWIVRVFRNGSAKVKEHWTCNAVRILARAQRLRHV